MFVRCCSVWRRNKSTTEWNFARPKRIAFQIRYLVCLRFKVWRNWCFIFLFFGQGFSPWDISDNPGRLVGVVSSDEICQGDQSG